MQPATAETVLADFNDAVFDHHGTEFRFSRRNGDFWVRTAGPDGKPTDYKVEYAFGIEPLQQYLVPVGGGRLQTLTVCWDTEQKRWFALHDEPIPWGDWLHWAGPQFNWNFMCAECHSTNLQREYDVATNTYATSWSEINVSCEACHGPGKAHVAWANARAADSGPAPDSEAPYGLAISLKDAPASVEAEACARCHARRVHVWGDYQHGKPLLDHYEPRVLTEGLYHADGQILDEVYVYGSFVQSRKFHAGVRCTDCHDPHTTKVRIPGNGQCMLCHRVDPPERFPTLKKKLYASPEHHFHEPDTPGAQCVNCHMPATNYMVVDPRRDHSFRIPRPDLTVSIGTPNACNGCHEDKDAKWAAAEIDKRFPRSEPRPEHFAVAFTAARAGNWIGARALLSIAADTEQPGIVRATALQHLRGAPWPRRFDVAGTAARDPDPLVRVAAANLLGLHPDPARRARMLAPMLRDSVRAVRVEAARLLASVPQRVLPPADQNALRVGLDEFRARQASLRDRPDSYLNLAVLDQDLGDPVGAEKNYRRALALDKNFWPARVNLANLLNAQGRNQEAAKELERVLADHPDNGEVHYSLGLLRAEMGDMAAAAAQLASAAELLKNRARVQYNAGLALLKTGSSVAAEAALLRAIALAPEDPEILDALAYFYAQAGDAEQAAMFRARAAALTDGRR